MSVDKLTDEERQARRLSIAEVAAKIQAEYGEALAALGQRALVRCGCEYDRGEVSTDPPKDLES